MRLEEYTVDKEAEVNGAWFHIKDKKTCVCVARWGNPKHASAMSLTGLSRAERKRYAEDGEIDYEARAARTLDEMSEFIFLDFGRCKANDCPGGDECEGIEHDGKPIENTKANRREMLDRAPSFFTDIHRLSIQERNFREKALKKLEGNSDASSAGSARGRSTQKRSQSKSKRSKKKA